MKFLQKFSVVVVLSAAACGSGETITDKTQEFNGRQDPSPKTCGIDASYEFAYNPGFRYPYQFEQTTLSPARTFTHTLEKDHPPVYSCQNQIPDCYARTVAKETITIAHVMAAVSDPEVQSALKNSGISYNRDPRIADAPVYSFKQIGGGYFYVGFDNCYKSNVKGCNPAPAGVARLIDLMARLDNQQLAASDDCRELVAQR